ncbi:hypothetical protein CLV43_1141, partial [Umezawaea tangerina]
PASATPVDNPPRPQPTHRNPRSTAPNEALLGPVHESREGSASQPPASGDRVDAWVLGHSHPRGRLVIGNRRARSLSVRTGTLPLPVPARTTGQLAHDLTLPELVDWWRATQDILTDEAGPTSRGAVDVGARLDQADAGRRHAMGDGSTAHDHRDRIAGLPRPRRPGPPARGRGAGRAVYRGARAVLARRPGRWTSAARGRRGALRGRRPRGRDSAVAPLPTPLAATPAVTSFLVVFSFCRTSTGRSCPLQAPSRKVDHHRAMRRTGQGHG